MVYNTTILFSFFSPSSVTLRVPPSPARGEGLSERLPILLCSCVSASVRAYPLNGGVNCGTRPPLGGSFPTDSRSPPKPSPSRGKVAPPEAVTDEGEKNPRAAQPTNSKAKETPPKGSVPRKASIFHWSRLVLFLSCFDPQDKISNFGIGPTFGSQTQNHSSTLRHIHSEPSFVIVTIILPDYIKHFKAV